MQRFRESTTGYSRVNRDLGIIYDVRIINTTSRNKRRYLETALRDGIPLYEGATIGIDHVKPTPGNPAPEREFTKFWGQLKNVRWDGEGLIGDLHYIKSHNMTEHILEAAERFPEKFGLSHDADGDSKVGADGWLEVYKLTKVFSVDLVTNPGSTNGLFESMQEGFCPTGEGGGRKNTCSSRKGKSSSSSAAGKSKARAKDSSSESLSHPKLKNGGDYAFEGKTFKMSKKGNYVSTFTAEDGTVLLKHHASGLFHRKPKDDNDDAVPVYAEKAKGVVTDPYNAQMGNVYYQGNQYSKEGMSKLIKTGEPVLSFYSDKAGRISMKQDGTWVPDSSSSQPLGKASVFSPGKNSTVVGTPSSFSAGFASPKRESLVVSGSFKEGFILGGQAMSKVDSTVSGKHLFEEFMADEGMMSEMASEPMESDMGLEEAFKMEAMKVLDDDAMDSAAKLAKLKAIFKAKDQVMATLGESDAAPAKPASESTSESTAATDAADTEGETESEDDMKESVKKQIGDLQEENRQLRAKMELEQGKIACVKLLESAGCEATEVRVNALLRTPEKERKALLESFSSKPAKQRPASSPSALFESAGRAGEYPKDIKDFKAVLR